jgi:hypothetical protein
VDREDLAIGEVGAEGKRRQRQRMAGEHRPLVTPTQRDEDQDVGDQAELRSTLTELAGD